MGRREKKRRPFAIYNAGAAPPQRFSTKLSAKTLRTLVAWIVAILAIGAIQLPVPTGICFEDYMAPFIVGVETGVC